MPFTYLNSRPATFVDSRDCDFNRITKLAAQLFDVPLVAVVSDTCSKSSLAGCYSQNGQKEKVDLLSLLEKVQADELTVLEDLHETPEVQTDLETWQKQEVRFYAGIPLVGADTTRYGTLCLLDSRPRSFSGAMKAHLETLACVVTNEFELKRTRQENDETKRAIQKARNLLERTQSIGQIGGWEYDVEADAVVATPEFYRIVGVPEDTSLDLKTGLALFPEEARSTLRESVTRSLSTGESFDVELPFEGADSNQMIVRSRGKVRRDEAGNIIGLIGTLHDVTRQKQKEQSLRLHRNLLQNIFETSPAGITVLDTTGAITHANRRAEEILKIDREEVTSRRYNASEWKITTPNGAPIPDNELPFATIKATGKPVFGYIHAITWPNGSRRILEVNGTPLINHNGSTDGAVMVVADITDQWLAERDLRRSRKQLAEAQRIARFGSWYHKLDTGERYWSPQTCRIFGLATDETPDFEEFLSSVHPDDREKVKATQSQLASEGNPVEFEYRILRNQEARIVQERIEPRIDETGTVVELRGTVQDITKERKAEQELVRAKEEAERMNRLQTSFLTNMSHEVRTPLTSIIGFSEVMLEMDLEPPADRFAHHLLDAGERLLETFNSVLDFSQLEAGTKVLNPDNVVLQNELSAIMSPFAAQATRSGVSLDSKMPGIMVDAMIDRKALQHVMRNLLGNAIKFTEKGGRIVVRLGASIRTISIAIEDTGIGIDPEFLPYIFDPFEQESEGDTRPFDGTGLGLPITQKLVGLMGGMLEIKSSGKGDGTTVIVRFPRICSQHTSGKAA